MDWTDEMKSAAMADAAKVCKQAERIADLEAQLAVMRRERDDLRDILAGIGTQATRAAASYRDKIKVKAR